MAFVTKVICCLSVAQSLSRARLSVTLWAAAARPLRPRDFPGKGTGAGHQSLLQGTFPTRTEPTHPALQDDSLPWSHLETP